MTGFFFVYEHSWARRLRMCVPLSCLWVIWMAIIISGLCLRHLTTIMLLQHLTSQLCPLATTHARGETFDLLMSDAPDLVRVALVAPIGNSYITPLCRQSFRWQRRFQTCLLVGKFSWNIKSIGIQSVVQHWICPGATFGLLTILSFWTNICPCWLDVMHQLSSSMCTTRISLGLTINAGVLLASCMGLIFGGTVIAFELTENSLSALSSES